MKLQALTLYFYEIPLTFGQMRKGALIKLEDSQGNEGWGEIAPYPNWSKESLKESIQQINEKKGLILKENWTESNWLHDLEKLNLLPSALFGVESALLNLLTPLDEHHVPTSALLMGSPQDILKQAEQRHKEGYIFAKLKVVNLKQSDAANLIHQLKDKFRLRIDVNRAWKTEDSLRFFEQFPHNTFDYVEEPFQNPHDLGRFTHPLAIDESFPNDLSLKELETFPTLKALIYKPSIQGGLCGCLPLHMWAHKRGVSVVLSSIYESDIGLANLASIAQRLSLSAPVGIGTIHFLTSTLAAQPLEFSSASLKIPSQIYPEGTKIAVFGSTLT